jgi:hypothetical protein
MTMIDSDDIPNRLTRTGAPVFQLHLLKDMPDHVAALVKLSPPTWTKVEAAGICLAAGSVGLRDPLRCDTFEDYFAQPSCVRLAFHDGPHAFVDLDAKVVTFTECMCVDEYGFDECFHTADAIEAGLVQPELTIRIADEVTTTRP